MRKVDAKKVIIWALIVGMTLTAFAYIFAAIM